MYKWRTLQ